MRIINGRLDGKEIYDVYYSTGGGSLVGGGSDVWVNHWIKEIYPKLKVKSVLLIHRNRPERPSIEEQDKIFKELNKDLDIYWQGDDLQLFGSLLNGARRINILHGYYAPHKYILSNKDKIQSGYKPAIDKFLKVNNKVVMGFEVKAYFETTMLKRACMDFAFTKEALGLRDLTCVLFTLQSQTYDTKENLERDMQLICKEANSSIPTISELSGRDGSNNIKDLNMKNIKG